MVEPFHVWRIGGCRYQCRACQMICSSSTELWDHVREDHGFVTEEYFRHYGSGRIHETSIRCEICSEMILHDLGKMRYHLRKKHEGKIKLKEYYDLHVNKVSEEKEADNSPGSNPVSHESLHLELSPVSPESLHLELSPVSPESLHLELSPGTLDTDVSALDPIEDKDELCNSKVVNSSAAAADDYGNEIEVTQPLDDSEVNAINDHEDALAKVRESKSVLNASLHNEKVQKGEQVKGDEGIGKVRRDLKQQDEDEDELLQTRSDKRNKAESENVVSTSESQKKKRRTRSDPLGTGEVGLGETERDLKQQVEDEDELPHNRSDHRNKAKSENVVPTSESPKKKRRTRSDPLGTGKVGLEETERSLRKRKTISYSEQVPPNKKSANINPDEGEKATTNKKGNKKSYFWTNKCEFSCALCPDKFSSVRNFNEHVNRRHDLKFHKYHKEHGYSLSKIEMLECQQCKRKIVNHYEAVRAHLRAQHKISISEYHEKYYQSGEPKHNIRNACVFKCPQCEEDEEFGQSGEVYEHLREKHPEIEQHSDPGEENILEEFLTKVVIHPCRICGDKLYCDLDVIEKHITSVHQSNMEVYLIMKSYRKAEIDQGKHVISKKCRGERTSEEVEKENDNELDLQNKEGKSKSKKSKSELSSSEGNSSRVAMIFCFMCKRPVMPPLDAHVEKFHNTKIHNYILKYFTEN